MPNVVVWWTDGHYFRLYSDGILQLQTPFVTLPHTPAALLGIDPATGLPAICPAPAAAPGGLLAAGTQRGDMLWWDGSQWVLLAPGSAAGEVLTEQASGPDLIPVWQAPAVLTPPAVGQSVCGMARFLALKIEEGYNWYRASVVSACNLYLANLGANIATLDTIVTIFFPPVGLLASIFGTLSTATAALDVAHMIAAFTPLTPGQIEDGLAGSCYRGLLATTGAGVPDAAALAAIKAQIDAYPNWINGPSGTSVQPGVLKAVLTNLPLANWQQWAARGGADPSNSCAGF